MSLATLPAQCAFVSGFCSSGYDFAIPSSRLNLTIQTLGVATEFVGNYASVDFHHRALICPSYRETPAKRVALAEVHQLRVVVFDFLENGVLLLRQRSG